MLRWIKLEDLFKNPSRWPDPEKLYIGYTPDIGKITLSPVDRGTNLIQSTYKDEDEVIETTLDMKWNPHLTEDGKVILISQHPADGVFHIYGEQGCKSINQLLQKIGLACYSNDSIGAMGDCVNLKLFKTLSKYLQESTSLDYFLGTTTRETDYSVWLHKCDFSGPGAKIPHKLINYSMSGSAREQLLYSSFRPCVRFTNDILVDVRDKMNDGSKPDCALKIYLRKPEPSLSSLMDKISELEEENEELHEDIKQLLSEQKEIKSLLHYIANNMKKEPPMSVGCYGEI